MVVVRIQKLAWPLYCSSVDIFEAFPHGPQRRDVKCQAWAVAAFSTRDFSSLDESAHTSFLRNYIRRAFSDSFSKLRLRRWLHVEFTIQYVCQERSQASRSSLSSTRLREWTEISSGCWLAQGRRAYNLQRNTHTNRLCRGTNMRRGKLIGSARPMK